jgi:hypothetical protein
MRLTCTIPGFEHCFVELSDRWTRREVRAFREADTAEGVAVLRRKITAIHLDCADGNHITAPDQMTDERLDEVDTQVYLWMPGALMIGLRELENLGFRAGLRLFDTTGEASTQTKPSPKR